MFFLMQCYHRPDKDAARDELRAAHRDWVKSGGNGVAIVLTGSAMWDDDGLGIGNFGILSATDKDAAEKFAHGDPFAKGGVIRDIVLTRLADGFQSHKIEAMTQ